MPDTKFAGLEGGSLGSSPNGSLLALWAQRIDGTVDNHWALTDAKAYFTPTGSEIKTSLFAVNDTNNFDNVAQAKVANISITQAVDLDAIETRVNALDAAVVLSGTWDASSGSFPGGGTAEAGESYIVSVAGTVDGVAFSVDDRIIAITDNASTTTFANNWHKADYSDFVTSVAGKTGAVVIDADDIGNGDVSNTELSYLNGATSNIQAQIDAVSGVSDGDKGDVIVTSSGATWSIDVAAGKLRDAFVTPQMFGAVMDGTTDDQPAIHSARDAAISEGKTLLFLRGTYAVANPIELNDPIDIAGAGLGLTEIKATAVMTAVFEWSPAAAGRFHMRDIGINCNNQAATGIDQQIGWTQGSSIQRVLIQNATDKNLKIVAFCYTMNFEQLIVSGGPFGIHVAGNGPLNGATFTNCRISNTTDEALHIENTAISTSHCKLDNVTIEGNPGRAVWAENTNVLWVKGHLENNGSTTNEPDIGVSSHDSIVTYFEMYDVTLSSAGAGQTNRAELLATHTRFIARGPIYTTSNLTIDGGNFNTANSITLLDGADATISNFSPNPVRSVRTDGATFTGAIEVPDEVYSASWDGSTEVPTKNAVYDQIQTIISGSGTNVQVDTGGNLAGADFQDTATIGVSEAAAW